MNFLFRYDLFLYDLFIYELLEKDFSDTSFTYQKSKCGKICLNFNDFL